MFKWAYLVTVFFSHKTTLTFGLGVGFQSYYWLSRVVGKQKKIVGKGELSRAARNGKEAKDSN